MLDFTGIIIISSCVFGLCILVSVSVYAHMRVCVCAHEHVRQGLILSFDILTAPRDYVVH